MEDANSTISSSIVESYLKDDKIVKLLMMLIVVRTILKF